MDWLKTPLKPLKEPMLNVDFVLETTSGSRLLRKARKSESDIGFMTTLKLSAIMPAASTTFNMDAIGAARTAAAEAKIGKQILRSIMKSDRWITG